MWFNVRSAHCRTLEDLSNPSADWWKKPSV